MAGHGIGTREEWLAAREELLKREKEHTRHGDEIARLRRDLPWVPVEKDYRFETDDGEKSLAELFDGRSQLLVYPSTRGLSTRTTLSSAICELANGPTRTRRPDVAANASIVTLSAASFCVMRLSSASSSSSTRSTGRSRRDDRPPSTSRPTPR